jgi:hypothetical protein
LAYAPEDGHLSNSFNFAGQVAVGLAEACHAVAKEVRRHYHSIVPPPPDSTTVYYREQRQAAFCAAIALAK